jgi:hypothetical protein
MAPKIGYIPWNKGKKCPTISINRKGIVFSKEHIKNLSKSHIGKNKSKGAYCFPVGHKINIGRKQNTDTIKKRSESLRKRYKNPTEKIINRGTKISATKKRKIAMGELVMASGENHYNWKGGITPTLLQIRHCDMYKCWVHSVFKRDNYTCQYCSNIKGHNLNAHHKYPFSKIIQDNNIKTIEDAQKCHVLWDINNGVTLCEDCHIKTHKAIRPEELKLWAKNA